jgi:hypothetical protein
METDRDITVLVGMYVFVLFNIKTFESFLTKLDINVTLFGTTLRSYFNFRGSVTVTWWIREFGGWVRQIL